MSHEETAIESVLGHFGSTSKPIPVENEEPAAKTEAKFEFDTGYQEQIAALCLRSDSFVRSTYGLIKPEYFESNSQAILVNIALDTYDKYRKLPTLPEWKYLLNKAMKSRMFRDDMRPEVIATFKKLKVATLPIEKRAIEECANFACYQEISKATFNLINDLENLKTPEKVAEAKRNMLKAFDVGANDNESNIDYFDKIGDRTEARKQVAEGKIAPQGISTGFKKLDAILYHKGWGRKEITVFMAGAKQGKSAMLGDICLRTSLDGYNCLYVSLELSKEIISARLDANISDTPISEIEESIFSIDKKVKAKADTKNRGHLKIAEYSPETFTPTMLRRLLERYRNEGIQFDLIAVDYADIMAPDLYGNESIENSKSVWLGLGSIAKEENAALLTATQTNREGHKSATAKAETVASDFNKIRIADLVISINSTEQEEQDGIARLFFAASRNQAGGFSMVIKRALSKGQAMLSVKMEDS